MGLLGSQGFEPPNILRSWIVARFRDRILHMAIHMNLIRLFAAESAISWRKRRN
jgi:hypothetical protein